MTKAEDATKKADALLKAGGCACRYLSRPKS